MLPTECMIIETETRIDSFCCEGYQWEVLLIFPSDTAGHNSIWGICDNPCCPNYQANIGPDDPYRGVKNACEEDILEWLEQREQQGDYYETH